jgi:hypothetical protein
VTKINVMNSFTVSAITALAHRLKIDTEKTSVSDWIGTPSSWHSAAEGLAPIRLRHIFPSRYVQSGQTPKRRCAPLNSWCRAWCIVVRSFASSESKAAREPRTDRVQALFLPLIVRRRLSRPGRIHRAKAPSSAMRFCCRARVVEEPSAPRWHFSIVPTARQAR